MATIKDTITTLAKKAGIDVNDAKYAPLLAALAGDIPDEIATAIDSNLFNVDIAKNHSALDKHFKVKNLNGVDAKIKAVASKNGLTDEEVAEIFAEPSSYERIELLNEKVKEKLQTTLGGSDDKKKLIADIQKLNADIVAIKTNSQKELQAAKEAAENDVLNYAVDSHLQSQKYANEDIPVKVNATTANILLQNYLKEKGAKLVRRDGELVLINANSPDLDYMENNQKVKFSDLTAKVLADNKLLKVSDPTPAGGRVTPQTQRTDRKQGADTSAIAANNRAAAAALTQA
jgi:hypothetical protein